MPTPPYVRELRKHVGRDLLVGGIVDPGEQPAEAVLREIMEETGIEAAVERIVGVALLPFTYPNGDICQFLDVWFRCRAVSGEARVNDDESIEVAWFDTGALPDLDGYTQAQIESAIDPNAQPWFAQPGESYPRMNLA